MEGGHRHLGEGNFDDRVSAAPTLRHKPAFVEMGRFRGENPAGWIFQIERYFEFYNIAETQRLSLALFIWMVMHYIGIGGCSGTNN